MTNSQIVVIFYAVGIELFNIYLFDKRSIRRFFEYYFNLSLLVGSCRAINSDNIKNIIYK